MRVRSWGLLPQAKYCKNGLRGIPLFGKFRQTIPILAILGAVLPHFLTDSDAIWHEGANLGCRPQAKFCKNRLRGYTLFWANLYQKLPVSAILGVVSPHFISDTGEIWPEIPSSSLNFFFKIA